MSASKPRKGSSSRGRASRPRTTSTKTRKTGTKKNRGRRTFILPALCLLLLGVTGLLGFRLAQTGRTLREQAERIGALQDQLLSARTRKPEQPITPPATQEYTPHQQAILKGIVNTPDIAQLIPQKPSLGGQWRCFSEDQVFFLDRTHVAFTYEDGHTMGAAIVEIPNPEKRSTWKVIWSGPL